MFLDTIKRWRWWLFLLIAAGAVLSYWEHRRRWIERSQDKAILQAAGRYRVDPALIKAVVWRESGFNPKAQGSKGEIGLMQIRQTAAEEWAKAEKISLFAHRQLFDPEKNTLAGTWYLRKLLARYGSTDNPIPYALADYNAGRTRVLQWNGGAAATNSAVFIQQIEFPTTKEYIRSVSRQYARYQKSFGRKNQSLVNLHKPWNE